jgi:hypothetical protein
LWWNRIRDDIQSQGGHVHELLEFDEFSRELKILKDEGGSMETVDSDTTLFQIPVTCMVTRQRALTICPWLHAIEECRKGEKQLVDASIIKDSDKSLRFPAFYNDPTDVMIAIALASESPEQLLYLQSLPPSSVFDSLPRRWSDDIILQHLWNTSVFDRVQAAKMGTVHDYGKAKDLYELQQQRKEVTQLLAFPSLDRFSDMLAAVMSRAFQLGDSSRDIALVPLLDLSNHSRGSREEKKNVNYQLVQDNGKDAFMMVKSVTKILHGECLRLTYGALGNAQLLMNYGFCIPQNIEPDGSSNDVLELEVARKGDDGKEVSVTIPLRAGPKSYSYSGFKGALDAFRKQGPPLSLTQDIENDNDDFESFLNETSEDEDGEYNGHQGFDSLYEGADFGGATSDEKGEIEDENDMLHSFREALVKKFGSYKLKGESLKAALAKEPGPENFAGILCHSEQRTIFFFLQAVEKVLSNVCPNNNIQPRRLGIDLAQDDLDMITKQTTELSSAYLAIRGGL